MPIEAKLRFTTALDEAIHRCVMTGTHPTELWLGPDMLAEFMADMDVPEVFDGSSVYDGLTIRFMRSDGLRVGKTFPHEDHR